MAKYRILALDGGGIRGLLPAVLMQRLDLAVPGWRDRIDLIAGTSTGGIIALGLAKGLNPTEVRNIYYDRGSYIFYRPWWQVIRSLGVLIGAKHPNDHLRAELQKVLGENTRLRDLKKKVLISSFSLEDQEKKRWKPKFFHNFDGNDSDGDEKVVDIALYTSAAPTYFPSVNHYVDGGVAANNPSMAAVAQTQDDRAKINPRPQLHEIVVLSFGTGDTLSSVGGKNLNWGYIQWGWKVRLLQILMDGVVGIPDYQCRQLLGDQNYYRVNPILPPDQNFEMDDASQRDALVAFAEKIDISDLVSWLENTWIS